MDQRADSRPDPLVAPPDDGRVHVRGARLHNLRDVSVTVPRDALVVFTGVSGSGKSSLAFGTIHAEAQRRYLESVSPYARRLIEQAGAPEVDAIDGLPPTVALRQQRGASSPRSTVGSLTTLSDLLRLLYSRAGRYPVRQPMLYAEDFSPNTPQGACPACHGLGRVFDATEASMVPDPSLTIRERAIASWPPAWQGQNQRDILVSLGHDVDRPWRELPRRLRDWILFTEERPTAPVYAGFTPADTRHAVRRRLEPSYQGTFIGARRYLLHTLATTQSHTVKRRVSRFLVGADCATCGGKRLKREALSVRFAGRDIAETTALPIDTLADVLAAVAGDAAAVDDERSLRCGQASADGDADADAVTLTRAESRRATARRVASGGASHAAARDVRLTPHDSPEKRLAAKRLAREALLRIDALRALGLGYLSLDRTAPTLSPGELQRLRLATQLRSNLFGVVYVLDEPSAGLHPADGEALLDAFDALVRAGNSLFVVEHDMAIARRADWLVDVGPDAGDGGGHIVHSGPPQDLVDTTASRTARWLHEDAHTVSPASRAPRAPAGWLELRGVTRNTLKALDVRVPLGVRVAVTGVSGAGKSSLVSQALVELVGAHLGESSGVADDDPEDTGDAPSDVRTTGGHIAAGAERIRRLVQVDQRPIGRTPRSNLATYTGLFDAVRRLFAATPDARRRRFDASRFSFNLPAGRCPTCEGDGVVEVELLFLPSVHARCPACAGTRYEPRTLAVRWQGLTIAQVLELTVDAACATFAREPAIARSLATLREIGLGYLRLGQPATELSGGEAQRIKLATELQRPQRADTLYVLDEPTTGLHPSDVERLVDRLDALVDAGNSVIVVEHDPQVIAGSDWVIDVGPGAGERGGRIVASGTPGAVAATPGSVTGRYLARSLPAGAQRPAE